jgi:hypothetical protein
MANTVRNLALFIMLGAAVGGSVAYLENRIARPTVTAKSVVAPEVKETPIIVESKPNWSYGENSDKMTGEVTKWAMTDSTNKVNMKFPYNGGSEGTIVVFTDGVKIHLSKGQVMCSNYSGCSIKVKFDNEQPEYYNAVGPSNGQSNYVFLGSDYGNSNGARKFVNKLKTANNVMISIEMYQEHSPVWEFNVNGLAFHLV